MGSPPGVPTAAGWQQPAAIILVFAFKTNTFLTLFDFLGLGIPKKLVKPMKNQHFCFWDLPSRSKKLVKPMKNHHFCVLGCLGLSWVVLGRPRGVLGVSWGLLGPSWGVLGAAWGVVGRLGGVLVGSWGRLGTSWGRLGASWVRLGGILGFLRCLGLPKSF